MKISHHKNADISIRLTADEADMLWCIVREGRAQMSKIYKTHDANDVAFDILKQLRDHHHTRARHVLAVELFRRTGIAQPHPASQTKETA